MAIPQDINVEELPSAADGAAEPLRGPVFLAAGDQGARAFTADGVTWKNLVKEEQPGIFRTSCFGNGRCVVCGGRGGQNLFAMTKNGVSWETSTHDAEYSKYVRVVFFYNGEFYALGGRNAGGDTKPFVMTSEDGLKWGGSKQIGGRELLRRVAFGEDRIVAVGDYGRKSVSTNGREWDNAEDVKAVDTLIDVAYGKGMFVGGGLHGLRMASEDGRNWAYREHGEEGEHINTMIFDGRKFVGIGLGATYFSEDGKAWERQPNTNPPLVATFGHGFFGGAMWRGVFLGSADGVTWKPLSHADGQHIETIAAGELEGS